VQIFYSFPKIRFTIKKLLALPAPIVPCRRGNEVKSGLRNAIQAEMQCRSQRYKTIPPDLLGEPAWDILLDLAISLIDGKRVQITAVGLTSGLAPTTALRWICRLEERGLIRRIPDADDGRRTWLEILPESMARLAACFGYKWQQGEPATVDEAPDETAEYRIFFTDGAQQRSQDQFPLQSEAGKQKAKALLLKRATDWVNQDYDERLGFAAQALYVHGYLSPHEYRRIEMQVREDAEHARGDRVRARMNSFQ
jgi:DNA-binding MarR family transcriptional regulator